MNAVVNETEGGRLNEEKDYEPGFRCVQDTEEEQCRIVMIMDVDGMCFKDEVNG